MAWYRAGGGGIPAALKTGMNDVLNKKFGTSTTYAPNTWPDNVNLLGKLPEKTVSGAIAHIIDGADRVPVKNWQVTIAPTLSGVSSVGVVQTGKNLYDIGTASDSDYLGASTRITDITGNVLTINIKASGGTFVYRLQQHKKVGTFTFSMTSSKTYSRFFVRLRKLDDSGFMTNSDVTISGWSYNSYFGGWYKDNSTTSAVQTITIPTCLYWEFGVGYANNSVNVGDNETLSNIQIEVGSTASDYTPYVAPTVSTVSLGRTIYGGSVDVVAGTGTETYGLQTFDGTEGTGGTPSWTMISVTQGTMFRITVSDKATTSATNTLCSYYTPTAQAQRADGTVSGAGTDVDIIDNRFSSVDAFKAWLAENPVTLVYELSTSTDFTFTPITPTPETALGVNNFWSDGDSQVTYRRDIDLALGGA